MTHVTASHSTRQLQEWALSMALSENNDKVASKDAPKQEDIESMAKLSLLSQGITAIAALEVILFMKRNLRMKVDLEGGSACCILSAADVLTIAKHSMGLLRSVFQPYQSRLAALSADDLSEVCQRIAGIYHRAESINVYTGSGISFTGLTKLYYEHTSLNKMEAAKLACGIGSAHVNPIYYIRYHLIQSPFPRLKEIEAVVGAVMGVPK